MERQAAHATGSLEKELMATKEQFSSLLMDSDKYKVKVHILIRALVALFHPESYTALYSTTTEAFICASDFG